MRFARPVAVAALIAAAFISGDAAAEEPRLTCTFVHSQCLIECGKEAGPMICLHYCNGRKNSCMFTGRWTGRHGDVFPHVIKE